MGIYKQVFDQQNLNYSIVKGVIVMAKAGFYHEKRSFGFENLKYILNEFKKIKEAEQTPDQIKT